MRYLILLILIFMTITAHAQIEIVVRDIQDNEPLNGANLTHISSGKTVVTNEEGRVTIDGSNTGTWRIGYVGYQDKKVNISSNQHSLTFYMEPEIHLLNAVEVTGYENEHELMETIGSYGVVENKKLELYNDDSFVRSINTLPGIRMEERSTGSYRISIRGNLLRAPYGVRNVKVYWNDIPFTDPTGNTSLNFIDNSNIQRVEVIKGPAGSLYGAGMGGVILLKSRNQGGSGLSGNAGYSFGSFGYHKTDVEINNRSESHQLAIRYARQKSDGYREHTNLDRENIQVMGQLFNSEKSTVSFNALYTDLFYELPGGLTAKQYADDPTQARPESITQNALLKQQNFFAGISHDYHWNENTGNVTSVYYSNGIKENPFITNYETEKLKGYGVRTKFYRNTSIAGHKTKLMAGGEFQYGNFHADNHGNVNGYADTLRYEDVSKVYSGFAFTQADLELNSWIFTAAVSLNYLKYDFNRLKDVALDSSYQVKRTFHPEISPRIGALKKLSDEVALHGSVSFGFSPPTQDEVRTSDGNINDELDAEKGVNYEVGIRGNALSDKLSFDISLFYMRQYETIVSRTLAGGNATFRNVGSTDQKGIEALFGWKIIDNNNAWISSLKLETALTYHNFKFNDYVKSAGGENVDYSDNTLTGTAPYIAVTTLNLETKNGFFLFLSHNFTDEIPLDDANTVFSNNYHLVNAKAGWKLSPFGGWSLEISAGIDNLLNKKYSLGNDLNAFGNRYYNPSPKRNYFVGLNVNF